MSKLKTIKAKAKLSQFRDYVALKANETRWNANYRRIKRYFQLLDAINEVTLVGSEIGREIASCLPRLLKNDLHP
jgi:hypothetical protein